MQYLLVLLLLVINAAWAVRADPAPNFNIGFVVLHLQPASGSNEVFLMHQENTTLATHYIMKDFDSGFAAGFRLFGSHIIDEQNDITLSWLYHQTQDYLDQFQPVSIPGNEEAKSPFVFSFEFTDVTATWRLLFNAVNIEWGRQLFWVENKVFRMHFGAHWAEIGRDITLILNDREGEIIEEFHDNSHIRALGPRAGLNFKAQLEGGLHIAGNMAVGILAAKQRHTTRFIDPEFGDDEGGFVLEETAWRDRQYLIVSAFDADVRLLYQHAVPNGDLTWFVGWQFLGYTNVNRALHDTSSSGRVAKFQDNDFGFHGPLFGFIWTGHA